MINNAILLPMFAMVVLTVIVWVIMYRRRVAQIRKARIRVQDLADTADAKELLKPAQAPAENFINLFEVPVLFYAAVLTAYLINADGWQMQLLFWIYAILRYVHSYIQLTTNIVMQRFRVYALSCFTLWAAWLGLAWQAFL